MRVAAAPEPQTPTRLTATVGYGKAIAARLLPGQPGQEVAAGLAPDRPKPGAIARF